MNASEKAEFILRGVESLNADIRSLYADMKSTPWQFVFFKTPSTRIYVYSSDHSAFGRLKELCTIAEKCGVPLLASTYMYKEGLHCPCVVFCLYISWGLRAPSFNAFLL